VRLAEATPRLLAERYTVIVGLDGELALELVKQHQPRLLVTDVEMPVLIEATDSSAPKGTSFGAQ
jgi:CheY-like chemotaxis protein